MPKTCLDFHHGQEDDYWHDDEFQPEPTCYKTNKFLSEFPISQTRDQAKAKKEANEMVKDKDKKKDKD